MTGQPKYIRMEKKHFTEAPAGIGWHRDRPAFDRGFSAHSAQPSGPLRRTRFKKETRSNGHRLVPRWPFRLLDTFDLIPTLCNIKVDCYFCTYQLVTLIYFFFQL